MKNRYLLALSNETTLPAYPVEATQPEPKAKGVKGKRRKEMPNAG